MKQLWEEGIIDASWKCWHCLATQDGSSYGNVVGMVRHLYHNSANQQRRREHKRQRGMSDLVQNDISRNSNQIWIKEAGARLSAALHAVQDASSK